MQASWEASWELIVTMDTVWETDSSHGSGNKLVVAWASLAPHRKCWHSCDVEPSTSQLCQHFLCGTRAQATTNTRSYQYKLFFFFNYLPVSVPDTFLPRCPSIPVNFVHIFVMPYCLKNHIRIRSLLCWTTFVVLQPLLY